MDHRHCTDFSHANASRAVAGDGLPPTGPGMPTVAGTGLTRRTLLLRGLGAGIAVYGASALRWADLAAGTAEAATAPAGAVLVSVFAPGGLDGMSLLAPVGDPRYAPLRGRLALKDGHRFAPDDRLRWHPAAAPLAQLADEGLLTVIPAVGYSNADQSHFTSRHYWEVGATDTRLATGWMGRLLDASGDATNPLQGLSLAAQLAPSLATARVPVAAIGNPADYHLWTRGVWGRVGDMMIERIGSIGAAHAGSADAALAAVGAAATQSHRLYGQLGAFRTDDGMLPAPPVPYPKGDGIFPSSLAALAAMLAAGLPLRCVALDAPGDYDTHDNQPRDFAEGVGLLSQGLLAFQRDLEARGLADRVVVHMWSEFGRRARANSAMGTDHGAGGVSLLIGSRVRGGLIGEFPGLSRLDEDGNLRSTTDFRSLYASLGEQWLGVDASRFLPDAGRFARVALLR